MTTTREAFESWFANKDFGPNGLRQIDAEYVHAPAATYWRVWQAAIATEREACALVCTKRNLGDGSREDQEAVNCANDIKRRGEL